MVRGVPEASKWNTRLPKMVTNAALECVLRDPKGGPGLPEASKGNLRAKSFSKCFINRIFLSEKTHFLSYFELSYNILTMMKPDPFEERFGYAAPPRMHLTSLISKKRFYEVMPRIVRISIQPVSARLSIYRYSP